MAFSSVLFRCIARAAAKHSVNFYTFGIGGDLLFDIWESWKSEQNDAKRRAELERLALVSPAEARPAARQAIDEVGAHLTEEQRRQLSEWLAQTPAALRRSLRRPEDPSGRTVPAGMPLRGPADLAGLLLNRPPRFRPGTRPFPSMTLELTELLGIGGCGEVWKASDPKMPDEPAVALKFCTEAQAREQLENELAMLNKVQSKGKHPGIVRLLRPHLLAEPPCLEYEYVEGGDLGGLVQERHRSGQGSVAGMNRLMLKLADIVAFAHGHDIVHRDLKPANILVARSTLDKEQLRVTDFGIGSVATAQVRRETYGTASMATVARGSHTPLYASPQQKRGGKADKRDDVYSLGVIWNQLLTGDLNAAAPTGGAWKDRLRRQGMTAEVLTLLERCVEERAEDRPGDAAELVAGLRVGVEGKLPTRRRVLVASLGLAVAGGGGLLAWEWRSGGGPGYPPGMKREISNSIAMKFSLIPSGKFTMGSPEGEDGHSKDEKQHLVKITKAFYLGVHEVTQKQFRAVMGYNPSYFSTNAKGRAGVTYGSEPGGGKGQIPAGEDTEDYPVENVSWEEAKEFCDRLTALEAEKGKSGLTYRLPTEAEWEYGCRGGVTSYQVFNPFGNSLSSTQANFDGSHPYGGAAAGVYLGRTCKVGSYPANGFGLHDMHGNVWEWCADVYDGDYYAKSPEEDPPGPAGGPGSDRVFRGGCWYENGRLCRSADRNGYAPADRRDYLGVRVALAASRHGVD